MTEIEIKRQKLQEELDSGKGLAERNKMGQFSTPYPLACQICEYIKSYTGDKIESFLEPSIGTGVFYSSLSEITRIQRSVGYEVDAYYFNPSKKLWGDYAIELINQNFLYAIPTEKFSLIIANPPYSRHHHIPKQVKSQLATKLKELYNIKISSLAGLHIYFIILSTQWLKDGGYSCWLVPTEIFSVNYGIELKKFLLNNVDLISIHSYDNLDIQFSDALVSSTVLVFRKGRNRGESVKFSWGNDINDPDTSIFISKSHLNPMDKWNRDSLLNKSGDKENELTIGSFFDVKRGIATGDNKFFIIDETERERLNIPRSVLSQMIPPPRKLENNIYKTDTEQSNNLYLITCREPIDIIRTKYTGLYNYLVNGEREGVDLKANCRNRSPWYGLEKRAAAPILVSYMGRDKDSSILPIRFILNQAKAIATNSYLCLYPKDEYKHNFKSMEICKMVWHILSSIPKSVLLSHCRSYGGGLLKWEPKELESIPCPDLDFYLKPIQPSLFEL